MAVLERATQPHFIDKEIVLERLKETDKESGFVPMPGATAEQSRLASARRLQSLGIDPNDIVYPQHLEKLDP